VADARGSSVSMLLRSGLLVVVVVGVCSRPTETGALCSSLRPPSLSPSESASELEDEDDEDEDEFAAGAKRDDEGVEALAVVVVVSVRSSRSRSGEGAGNVNGELDWVGWWMVTSKLVSDEGSEYKVGGEESRVVSAPIDGDMSVEAWLLSADRAAAWAWACFCFCSARRAASCRRARDGGMLRGGGGGGPRGVEEGLEALVLALLKVSRARSEDEM